MSRMEFGYHPPSGDRGIEIIRPREYLSDLYRALDVAAQSFRSLWISDHLAYSDEFRLESWTHLSWIAARYPDPRLGTIVKCNSWRQPSLMAKMASSLHWLSGERLILGFDFSVLTFPRFQEPDDLKLFVDEVMPAFA